MPLFYFNIRNDFVTDDHEGLEFADEHAARAYAIEAARTLAAEAVGSGHLVLSHHIDIADEDRTVVATVTFADAVKLKS